MHRRYDNRSALTSFTAQSADLDKEARNKIVGPYEGPVTLMQTRAPAALSFSRCGDARSVNVMVTIFGDNLGAAASAGEARVQIERVGPVRAEGGCVDR